MTKTNPTRVEQIYEIHFDCVMSQLDEIRDKVRDIMPVPNGEAYQGARIINWAHVGDLAHVSQCLSDVCRFLTR